MEEEKDKQAKVIKAQAGGQNRFVRSNVDVCFFGGSLGGGKTFGAILAVAEPALDPNFRAIFIRRNLGDLKTSGGAIQSFEEAFGKMINVRMSDSPLITFPSGATVEARHVADENPKKVTEQWKGVQADLISFEELTSFNWNTFTYLMTRNRGKGKWTGKIRATLNPKKTHWVRKFLDDYIGYDGFVKPEMDSVVRYFYINGEKVEDVVWGSTKREVYDRCRVDIDRKLKKLGGNLAWESMIKSFSFILGALVENKAMLANNEGYIGSVAASGGRMAQALIEGNWDCDPEEELDLPISSTAATEVFMNDEQTNGDNWITVDLADKGTDNLVALVWNGLHVIDKLILSRSTPRENAERVQMLAAQHKIGDSHIIFDGTAAAYFNDYIPEAIPYISNKATIGLYGRMAMCLKDECYLRLVEMIKHGRITIDESVGQARYYHENLKQEITIRTEFCEECSVVRFKEVGGGRKRLMNKKEMNAMLGKGRSMDILDACAMRMYPLLEFPYGEELESTRVNYDPNKDEEDRFTLKSIYDPSTWA